MASILIPRRFYRRNPYEYYSSYDAWTDPWGDIIDAHSPFSPCRRHCQFHGLMGLLRRRPDLHPVHRVAARRRPPLRLSLQKVDDDDDGGDGVWGIPHEYISLVERAARALDGERRCSTATGGDNAETNEEGGSMNTKCQTNGQSSKHEKDVAQSTPPTTETKASEEKATPATSTDDSNPVGNKVACADSSNAADNPFNIFFKLGDFPPENIDISMDGRQVRVRAKSDEQGDDGRWVRRSQVEYSFVVPESTAPSSLTSSFDTNGVVSITAQNRKEISEEADNQLKMEMGDHHEEQSTEKQADSDVAEHEAETEGSEGSEDAERVNDSEMSTDVDSHIEDGDTVENKEH